MPNDIDVGDCHIEKTEWDDRPPPPKEHRVKGVGVKKGKRAKFHKQMNYAPAVAQAHMPGYLQWRSLRQQQRQDFLKGRPGGRLGVPDGFSKEKAIPHIEKAKARAKQDLKLLMDKDLLNNDDAIAVEATQVLLEEMRMPGDRRLRQSAAFKLLEFYKVKPVSKQEVTVQTAESWLASLVEDEKPAITDQGGPVIEHE